MPSASKKLSPCQQKALDLLEKTQDNLFISGRAGSGKSFLIRHFLKGKDPKLFPIVASTGAAAVLVGGRTFHSFFGLGIMEGGFEKTIQRALANRNVLNRLHKIEGFVLDEVSMIPGAALKAAETICRKARYSSEPWGDARVIAVGDFAQLPPINRFGEKKDWCFLSESWEQSKFTPIVLQSIMRSQDLEFTSVLNYIRDGIVNDEVKNYLNSKTDSEYSFENTPDTTHLFPRRDTAEDFNRKRLFEIESPLREFHSEYFGDSKNIDQMKRQAPIPEILQLKISALVMIRQNDMDLRYVNGSLGYITEMNDDSLKIKLKKSDLEIELEKTTFSLLDAEGAVMASASNFPVTLAYATTIHKAQGATLDELVCDLRRLWEAGQAYVALSRLRKGDGLRLLGWDGASIKVDEEVKRFYQGLELVPHPSPLLP